MFEDAAGIRRVVIVCGYVDLRKGIDGLSMERMRFLKNTIQFNIKHIDLLKQNSI